MLNIEGFREYAQLDAKRKKAEGDIDTIKAKMAQLEPHLMENLIAEGIDRLPLTKLGTVFVHTRAFAAVPKGRKPDAIKALRKAGYGDIIKDDYNANTLSALVREIIKNHKAKLDEEAILQEGPEGGRESKDPVGDGLPPEFEGIISLGKIESLRVNKS
jgi:hypothetical protein